MSRFNPTCPLVYVMGDQGHIDGLHCLECYIDSPLTVRLMCYNVDNDVLHGP